MELAFEWEYNRMPLCHTGMIPWTAEFVANVANQGVAEKVIKDLEAAANSTGENADGATGPGERKVWTAAEVMRVARENAKAVYGV
jgi:TatD DNase family protein